MTTTEYDASTALRAFFPDRDERRTARVWANEALLHDMAQTFGLTFFEGSGTDPTSISGYASTKAWLRTGTGVTETPGEIRAYDGSSDPTLLASWPEMTTASAFADYIMSAATVPSPTSLADDLASTTDATKGAAMVAFKPSDTGGVGLPLATIFKRLELAPEQFGAVGDGSTNDSTAFTNLIAAAKTNKARIKLRADYNIASVGGSIDFPSHIIGPGKLIRPNNTATPFLSYVAGSDNSILEGVRFSYTNGSTTASVAHSAVRITAGRNIQVVNNRIDGGDKLYAGLIAETTSALDCLFEGNVITGIVNRAIYGYLGTKRLRIIGNSIDGYVSTTPTTNYGINLNDGGVAGCVDIVISGNIVRGTADQGIEVGNSCERITVTGNVLESTSTSGTGILAQIANSNRGRKAIISGNHVKGWGYAVYVYQSDDIHVSANQLEGTTAGIYVVDSTGVNVSANSSHNVSGCHYWFVNGDSCSLVGNTSRGGTATYDAITDASCDRILAANNQRHGGAGSYSFAGANITTSNNV